MLAASQRPPHPSFLQRIGALRSQFQQRTIAAVVLQLSGERWEQAQLPLSGLPQVAQQKLPRGEMQRPEGGNCSRCGCSPVSKHPEAFLIPASIFRPSPSASALSQQSTLVHRSPGYRGSFSLQRPPLWLLSSHPFHQCPSSSISSSSSSSSLNQLQHNEESSTAMNMYPL